MRCLCAREGRVGSVVIFVFERKDGGPGRSGVTVVKGG